MGASLAFFRFVAKAALNAVGGGMLGDFAVEALPEIARDIWGWWGTDRNTDELRQELQAVATLPPADARLQAAEIVAQEAAGRPETVRQALTAYLVQVPNAIRQSQRRPQDPSGRSVSSLLSLRRPEDLLPLLPPRPPRFKVGDRPPGIGDWELEELLGMGGFGEVWKARNPYLPQPIALKFCLDPAAAKVLRNEATLLGRVASQGHHPRIVRLLHTYLSADPPCLAYEYVAGGDLTGLIHQQLQKNQGKMPPDLALKIVYNVARSMRHPHRLTPPIAHRDLKPANILVQRGADGVAQLCITDFGIGGVTASQAIEQAKGATTGHFLATALRGTHTPLYASPQQIEGAAPDPRDDVYALGVIWYQMLVGDLSKGAPRGVGWKRSLIERGVPPPALELLQECFEDDPACRPADAGVLAERLGELQQEITSHHVTKPTEDGGGKKEEGRENHTEDTNESTKTATAYCADGEGALKRGEYTQAVRAYTQALKLDPDLVTAYKNRARAHLGKGDHEKALADFTEVIRFAPQDPEGYVVRGTAHRERGDADKAIGDFTRATTLGLRSAAVYIERGRAYAEKGVFDLAVADFGEALRVDPNAVEVYLYRGQVHESMKEHDRALADFSEAIRVDPTQGRFFNARGLAHHRKGESDLALADLIRALQLSPGLADAYHNRGQVYARKGNYEQAVDDYTQALKLGLKSGKVYYDRGLAHARLHKPGQAVADFTKAIRTNPRNPEIYLMRGLAHYDREDYAAAIADFARAIQRDRGYVAAYQNRGRAYLESGKYGKAVKDFTRVIERSPRRADAYDGRARAHRMKKQFDQAIADATEAIRLNPACASAYYHRSRAYAAKGELDRAIADASEAIRLDPRSAHYEARGLAYHERGQHDQAIADLSEAIRLDPKNGALYSSRGRVYAKKGDSAKAASDREKALKFRAGPPKAGQHGDSGEGERHPPVKGGKGSEGEVPWNGECYVSFGGNSNRDWEEARKCGFISAGGGPWYTRSLSMLEPGARIWVNMVGGIGYVGVGRVVEKVVPLDDFLIDDGNGKRVPITSLPLKAAKLTTRTEDPEKAEHMVRVAWLQTVPVTEAVREKGLFGNQNSAAKPRTKKWVHTVERLKSRFGISD
jgi:tetratricopeptide (TPR) repeat protein